MESSGAEGRCHGNHFLVFSILAAHWRDLANTTELSMCGGDVALCQITLTTCYYYRQHCGSATCWYLIYSEADFEVCRPAGATRCTDGGEIWHGGGDRKSPPPCQISPPSVQ